ncbi:hypothetical protein B0T21DRAFT_387584 [Apiosordaria backusii]|uniref:Heterokaryon incompatibility domain-containing protein n=1 Tax=Apiosordaria backusii TaxID=314023 RepID=A0AA40DR16_9PEZI|nr:hypothetical protein B0T21DRAFT_387584 [Apiosordaria backusii]
MRLLNTTTFELEQFLEGSSQSALIGSLSERDVASGHALPAYSILSHTWEEEEVLLEDMTEEGRRAVCYDWIWIDTCCIDKTSSSELSEAINSMFRWYKLSDSCYVYLSDTTSRSRPDRAADDGVHPPCWYSCGWTLQELIAPRKVKFYNRDWRFIGTRGDRPMAWLSKRKTTRIEDMAYCMLGIFNVSMPMLYGEGRIRLQEEIIRIVNDQSIFCWREHDLIDYYREEYGQF